MADFKVVYQDDKITTVQKPDGTQVSIATSAAPNVLQNLGIAPQETNMSIAPVQAPQEVVAVPQVPAQAGRWDMVGQGAQRAELPDNLGGSLKRDLVDQPIQARQNFVQARSEVPFWERDPVDAFSVEQMKQTVPQEITVQNPSQVAPVAPLVSEAPVVDVTGGTGSPSKVVSQGSPQQTSLGAQIQDFEKTYNNTMDEQKKFFDEEYKKVQEATIIDPNRALGSTSNKITAFIALALGGIGQGLMRSNSNAAADMLNKFIDNDITAQKENANNKLSLYNQLVKRTGDENAAKLMMKKNILDYTIKQMEMRAKTDEQRQNAALVSAQIDKLKAETDVQAASAIQKRTMQESLARMGGGQDPYFTGDYKDSMTRLIPKLGYANSTSGADEIRKLKPEHDKGIFAVKRLQEINKQPLNSLTPSLRAEATSLQRELLGALRLPYTGTGAFQVIEQQGLLKDVIGDINSVYMPSVFTNTKLKTLERALDNSYKSTLEVNGITPPKSQKELLQEAAIKKGFVKQ